MNKSQTCFRESSGAILVTSRSLYCSGLGPGEMAQEVSVTSSTQRRRPFIIAYVVLIWHHAWRLWCRLLLHINRFFLYFYYGGRPRTRRNLKAVLIGDGFAQSIGTTHQLLLISSLVHRLNLRYRSKPNIRLNWTFFERGYYRSTTEDWLPEGKLFKRTFASRACVDVEVVVVMVGLQDLLTRFQHSSQREDKLIAGEAEGSTKDVAPPSAKGSAKAPAPSSASQGGEALHAPVLRNLEAIVTHLRARGLRVCVCDVPMVGRAAGPVGKLIRAYNQQLKASVQGGRLHDAGVVLAHMSSPRVERVTKRSWDGVHLNWEGYKALTQELLEAMADQLVQAEWQVLKAELGYAYTTQRPHARGSKPRATEERAGEREVEMKGVDVPPTDALGKKEL